MSNPNPNPLLQAAQRAIEDFNSWQAYLILIGVEQLRDGSGAFFESLAKLRSEVSKVVHS